MTMKFMKHGGQWDILARIFHLKDPFFRAAHHFFRANHRDVCLEMFFRQSCTDKNNGKDDRK